MKGESADYLSPSRNLIEAMSWTLVSEFLRRYPGRFSVLETHPGGGMYDCLSLYSNKEHFCDFNRSGSIHLWAKSSGDSPHESIADPWQQMLQQRAPRQMLDRICTGLGLKVPSKLPAADESAVLFRVVAALLRMQVFDICEWRLLNGVCDTSDGGGGIRSDFDLFPGLCDRLRIAPAPRGLTTRAYSFWFLRSDDQPMVGFEVNGTAWARNGTTIDVVKQYRTTKNVAAAVAEIVTLFPKG